MEVQRIFDQTTIHPATRWIACAVISAVAAMMSTGTSHAGAVVVSEYVANTPAGATSFRPFRDIAGIRGDAVRSSPGDYQSYWSPLFEPEPGPHDPALSVDAPNLQFQQSLAASEIEASSELAARFQTRRGGDRAAQLERWEIEPVFRTTRVRDAIRLLLNVRREPGGRSRPAAVSAPDRRRPDGGNGGGNGGSIQAGILDFPLDQEMLDLIFSVLSPSLEPSGLISFSIAGLGNFLMVLSEEIGALQIIDLDFGNTLVMRSRARGDSALSRRNLASNAGSQRRGTATKITFQQFIAIVQQFFISIIQDPRFIGVLVIFSLLWLVLILYRRRV